MWNPLTARIRRLVDDVHDGDLMEASAHAGIPYAALREIHQGRVRRPGLATLERLARAYGLPVSWFIDESAPDDGTVPVAGWAGYLSDEGQLGRRVTIPHSAWPLIRVLVQLDQQLRDQPATADRPIIGSATDPREIRRRLTTFIFQPLLAAGAIGAAGFEADDRSGDRWASMLSDLGRFWERALGGLVPGLAATPASGPLGEVA